MLTDSQMNNLLVSVAGKDEAEIAKQVFDTESVLREVIRLIATHPEKLQNIGGPIRAVQKIHTVGEDEDENGVGSVFNVEVALTPNVTAITDDGIEDMQEVVTLSQDEVVSVRLPQPQSLFSCPHCDVVIQFSCPHCDKEFMRVFELQRHITCRHTGEKNFHCEICGASFALKVYLSYHMRAKHCPDTEKPYACTHCNYRCIQKAILQRHMLRHQSVQKYSCPVCKASFHRHVTLKRHMYAHKEKNLGCTKCNYKTADPYRLTSHIRLHDLPENFACEKCDFKCKEKNKLKRHMECHDAEKNFPCDKCDLVFKRLGNLKRHQYVHSERNLACEQCSYKTADPYELKRHLRIHSEGKKHACDVCDFRFARPYDLKKHKKVHERTHRCTMCNAMFAHPRELTNHRRRRHNNHYKPSTSSAQEQQEFQQQDLEAAENVVVISSAEDFISGDNPTYIQQAGDCTIQIAEHEGAEYNEVVFMNAPGPSVDQQLLEIASAIIAQVDEPKE